MNLAQGASDFDVRPWRGAPGPSSARSRTPSSRRDGHRRCDDTIGGIRSLTTRQVLSHPTHRVITALLRLRRRVHSRSGTCCGCSDVCVAANRKRTRSRSMTRHSFAASLPRTHALTSGSSSSTRHQMAVSSRRSLLLLLLLACVALLAVSVHSESEHAGGDAAVDEAAHSTWDEVRVSRAASCC